jgi:hypothetical protein
MRQSVMRTKKVTILLMLTVISLLTIFLVFLLDDTVLAAEGCLSQKSPNLSLLQNQSKGMMASNHVQTEYQFVLDELQSTEVVS